MTHMKYMLGLFFITAGIGTWYITYSILCKQKVTVYNRSIMKDKNYIPIEGTPFFKEQLYAGVIAGSLVVLTSATCTLIHLFHPLVLNYWITSITSLYIHLISHLFVDHCRRNGYITNGEFL